MDAGKGSEKDITGSKVYAGWHPRLRVSCVLPRYISQVSRQSGNGSGRPLPVCSILVVGFSRVSTLRRAVQGLGKNKVKVVPDSPEGFLWL
jgi:hypothetical protein